MKIVGIPSDLTQQEAARNIQKPDEIGGVRELALVKEKRRHDHADGDQEAGEKSLLPPHVVGV